MKLRPPHLALFVLTSITLLLASAIHAAEWHHPLYRDGGSWWDARIPIEIENHGTQAAEGVPFALDITEASPLGQLIGQPAESVRLCAADGTAYLFRLIDANGEELRTGPIPSGGQIVIPIECPANGKTTYYVYFNNPQAGELPRFLSVRTSLVNGGVEAGEKTTPFGWSHDRGDEQHKALWASDEVHSGKRSLKTVVAPNAPPSWIASRQHRITIVGGARYLLRGWVKGRNIQGNAGFYCHVGTASKPLMIAPSVKAGEGTFDWKEVRLELTAPIDADLLSLGTMLHGTGTAWFDDVSLERLDDGGGSARFSVTPQPCQTLGIARPKSSPEWIRSDALGDADWNYRATFTAANLSETAEDNSLLYVNTAPLIARFGRETNLNSLRVTCDGKPAPFYRLPGAVLIVTKLSPKSAKTICLYYSDDPDVPPADGSSYADLLDSKHNLIKNASFENGNTLPDEWKPNGPVQDATISVDSPGASGLGKACVKLTVPADSPEGWRGWTQTIPVSPKSFYVMSGYVQSSELKAARPKEFDPQAETPMGYASIHLHFHTADAGLCKENAMSSIGPPIHGSSDWTFLSNLLYTQPDAAKCSLHLTMASTGTLRHDGILAAKVQPCTVSPVLEYRRSADAPSFAVWPVNAIQKVFQADFVPEKPKTANVTLAKNEKEPLQLAVRATRNVGNVVVECDPLTGPDGVLLDDIEIGIIGYVPVDYPTAYYQSRSPAWHFKYPKKAPICDGWPGMWPDPLLPKSQFELKANSTQPVWITFGASKKTPAGTYRGTVRFRAGEKTLAQVPVTARVWDFTLPDENHVKAVYDVRMGPGGTRQWNGEDRETIYNNLRRFMAKRRLCADTITPAPKIEYKDGKAVCDFAEFDKAAAVYFDELGMRHSYTPWQFYLFGWGHPPGKKFGEAPYPGDHPYENVDRSQLRPEFKKAYQTCLKAFWDHLKQKDWEDRFILYISDEPFFRRGADPDTDESPLCDDSRGRSEHSDLLQHVASRPGLERLSRRLGNRPLRHCRPRDDGRAPRGRRPHLVHHGRPDVYRYALLRRRTTAAALLLPIRRRSVRVLGRFLADV